MEPLTNPVANPSRTDAKYQADQTQSARLRYQSLTENEGKTSFEVKPYSKTLQLKTFVDVQSLLLSDDEMVQKSDNEEVFAAREDMDKNIPPTNEEAYRITEDQWSKHEEAVVSYVDLRSSIKGYYKENVDHKDQTDKLVQETMDYLDKNSTERVDLLKVLNGVTETLKVIQEAVKDDPALNRKVIEAIKAYTKNSTTLHELLTLINNFDFHGLNSSVESLQAPTISHHQHLATWAKSSTVITDDFS
ncbi:hypothetical protein Tco_0265461 [Tanacetum coccineum]